MDVGDENCHTKMTQGDATQSMVHKVISNVNHHPLLDAVFFSERLYAELNALLTPARACSVQLCFYLSRVFAESFLSGS